MSLQIDFIIAVGLFFVVFLLVLGATNSYFSSSMESAHIDELRDNSRFLINLIYSESEVSITGLASKIDTTGQDDTLILWPSRSIKVVKDNKIITLQSRDYFSIKDFYNLDDFHISIADYLDFGPTVPVEGDVVSIHKPVLYEKSNGEIISRTLIVYSW